MSKRELGKLAIVVDVDAPRAKRRREAPPQDEKKPDPDMDMDLDATSGAGVKREREEPANLKQVKEQGLMLWQTVKDAVDKDGRSLSVDFLRLPNKRTYPDYYTVIKKPIALDKIKSQLDAGQYPSLIAVKNDLEQCFRNAKRYNLKDSQIFNDAKLLHKLTVNEYVNMTGDTKGGTEGHEDDPPQDDGHDSGFKDGFDDEGKRKRVMNRLLTGRLDKLVAKKDDAGNVLSNDFMELPNKKIWAIYYKTIPRPMSFEKIYKHLKRKEYSNVAQFAQDVELVFSNAMQFNEDHTPLWEAARQLKEYFTKLMSDLPAPYAVPQYASKDPQRPSNGKIKLKVPPAHQSPPQTSTSTTATSPPQPQTTSLMLKVPAKEPHAAQTRTVSPGPIAGPSTSSTSTAKTSSSANAQAPPATAQGGKSTTNNSPGQSHAVTEAATAEITRAPALRSVALTITPSDRRLALDARDGVRSWSLRLAPSERGLRVTDVRLFRSEDSDDEDEGSEEEEEEAEEEEEDEGDCEDSEDASGGGEGEEEEGGSKDSSGARVLELSDTRAGDHGKDPKGVWRVYLHCTA
ncbi:RSC complex protein [Russula emetica]|nr:RSC complex protein [Russula emetica]